MIWLNAKDEEIKNKLGAVDLWAMRPITSMPYFDMTIPWGKPKEEVDESWKENLSKLFEEKVKQIRNE